MTLQDLFGRSREFLHEAFGDATLVDASDHLPDWPARSYLGASGVHALVQMQPIDPGKSAGLQVIRAPADPGQTAEPLQAWHTPCR